MSFDRGSQIGRSLAEGQATHAPTPGKLTLAQSLVVQRSAIDSTPDAVGSPKSPPAVPPPLSSSRLLEIFSVGGARRPVQRKHTDDDGAPRSSPDETFARATAGSGSEIPHRPQMERAFGQSFAGVRAHLGQAGPMKDISARAATQGENVAFATNSPDVHLVAHELAHVVQNRTHGEQAVAAKSGLSQPGDASEVEADAIADRVASGGSVAGALGPAKQSAGACCDSCTCDGPVQRAAEPAADSESVAAARTSQRREATARVTSLVNASLPHIHKISSPQVAAQREHDLLKHVAVLEQHRDHSANAHGDPAADARALAHVSHLETTHGKLASAATAGSSEPLGDHTASPAKARAATKPAQVPATGKAADHGHDTPKAAPMVQRQVIHRSPECDDLLQKIIDLVNELKQRFQELREDAQHLQWDNWSVSNPKPGVGSVEGHQMQFQQKQTSLRNKLNDWNTDNCGDGGGGLPSDAWNWATIPTPVPIPQQRPAPADPSTSSSSDSSRTVWGVIAVGCLIGIGLLVAPEVTAPALIFAM